MEVIFMLGAIIGDIVGSVHEAAGTKTNDFPLFVPRSTFTDDSVLTVAVAEWILHGEDLIDLLHAYYHNYPGRGYGMMFHRWAGAHVHEPYNSFGNGAAMRVSPVGFAFETMEEVLAWSERSAASTNNHREGIRRAQATAVAIYLARRVKVMDRIRRTLESQFGYDLSARLEAIRPTYGFNETCQGTVPQALAAFFESTSYEDAIRNAISLGGDADTVACIRCRRNAMGRSRGGLCAIRQPSLPRRQLRYHPRGHPPWPTQWPSSTSRQSDQRLDALLHPRKAERRRQDEGKHEEHRPQKFPYSEEP
jgi:ADP-ribosylglycohydrolase